MLDITCRRGARAVAPCLQTDCGIRTGGTTMQSLAWRWTFAILIGSAWNLIAPLVFAQP
jgi:hypothetical protein